MSLYAMLAKLWRRPVKSSRVFRYVEPDFDNPTRALTIERTEAQILAEYYPFWCAEMRRVGKGDQINEADCINDWIVIHWADEVKP